MDTPHGNLLALTDDGSLHILDLQASSSTHLCTFDLPELPSGQEAGYFGAPRYRLHASSDGTYAAVVVDRGQSGIVIDTRSGATVMQLNGGSCHEDTVPFSACFLRLEGRDVFVHRTDWNRLDALDLATGRSLTERVIAPYEANGGRPEHYLDYFHGQLLPSPAGTLILDDGWVWQPISIPMIWSATAWLTANPWESEDGTSIVDLGARDDWSLPACWIDERRIALWGPLSVDADALEGAPPPPGVQILDVTLPRSAMADTWPPLQAGNVTGLFSDGARLYVATRDGTSGWDITSREPVADYPGFVAQLLDRKRACLLAFSGDTVQEIALLPVDRNGKPVHVGSRVRLLALSGEWFESLPADEKTDVESMIGEVFEIEEVDKYGHAWIGKGWSDGGEGTYKAHSIALEPNEFECLD